MGARLAHGFVFAVRVEPMVRFYEGVFGWRAARTSDPAFVRMEPPDAGHAGVAIHAVPAAIARGICLGTPPEIREDSAYKLCFETDDLAAVVAAVAGHGGVVGRRWEWEGTRYCECADPEGNVVQVFQRGPAGPENG